MRVSGFTRSETATETPRTAIRSPMKRKSRPGSAKAAERSMPAPDITKNAGMRKPLPMASRRVSSSSLPSGKKTRSTKPAAKAPSTESKPATSARKSKNTRRSTTRRSGVCVVAPALDRTKSRKRAPMRAVDVERCAMRTQTSMKTTRTITVTSSDLVESMSATAMTGSTSPVAP